MGGNENTILWLARLAMRGWYATVLYAMLCYVVPCHAVVLSVRRGAILRYHLQCCGEVDWLIDRLDGTLQYIDADRDLEGG